MSLDLKKQLFKVIVCCTRLEGGGVTHWYVIPLHAADTGSALGGGINVTEGRLRFRGSFFFFFKCCYPTGRSLIYLLFRFHFSYVLIYVLRVKYNNMLIIFLSMALIFLFSSIGV